MNLVGDAISADKASELGLANRVVPDHELFDQALQWARKLAGQPPLAVEQIKRVSNQADIEDGIEAEKRAFAGVFASEDAREGIEAFLQKRNPAWQGK
jgi:enoyl-CoA hydratase/3-hydroxyacyl-CoA dehydrogenase